MDFGFATFEKVWRKKKRSADYNGIASLSLYARAGDHNKSLFLNDSSFQPRFTCIVRFSTNKMKLVTVN